MYTYIYLNNDNSILKQQLHVLDSMRQICNSMNVCLAMFWSSVTYADYIYHISLSSLCLCPPLSLCVSLSLRLCISNYHSSLSHPSRSPSSLLITFSVKIDWKTDFKMAPGITKTKKHYVKQMNSNSNSLCEHDGATFCFFWRHSPPGALDKVLLFGGQSTSGK